MSLSKGSYNSGIKNLTPFQKGKSGFHFNEKEYHCDYCKIQFKSKGPRAKFCSLKCKEKCRPEKQKTQFVCKFCGLLFKRRAQNNAGMFCTRQCSGMWTTANGKKNYFYRAFLYKPHKCNRCDINDYELLCVHHIDFNHKNNDVSNLEILCANCHYRIHFGSGKTRKEKLNSIIEYLRRDYAAIERCQS